MEFFGILFGCLMLFISGYTAHKINGENDVQALVEKYSKPACIETKLGLDTYKKCYKMVEVTDEN